MLLEQSNEWDEIGKIIDARNCLAGELKRNKLLARRLNWMIPLKHLLQIWGVMV